MTDVVEKMIEAAEREINADGEINLPNAMLAALDALAESVSHDMGRAAELMLRECDDVGGIDDNTSMRRAIRAAILAAKG